MTRKTKVNTAETTSQDARVVAGATLARLAEEYGDSALHLSKANEATTRLLLIDEILEALGWEKKSFNPESYTPSGGYIDYLLELDGLPRVVVEAKRVGHTFGSPTKQLHRTAYPLTYMRQSFGASLAEVLEQAERYCHDVSVPYALVTNGAEWVLAQILPTPGSERDKLKCFYFGNLLGDAPNFELFWELLSRSSVEQGRLEEEFSHLNAFEAEYCVEPRSIVGELRWETPVDQPHLEKFYYRFFDEIIDQGRRGMLEHCYVSNPRLDQYEGELKRTLVDLAPAYLEDAEDLAPGDTAKVLNEHSGDQKGRVVLVVGSVGAGKSTFVTKTLVEKGNTPGLTFLTLDLVNDGLQDFGWVAAS